ncbi:hypothetical protein V12G01_06913 [Vibrio alginolyticus 12G01]|nr:hypothetical protein V12G01_06913 [Vibrio alginolyticus 12G01]KIP67842.1 hypothetical protein SN12_20835 [Vibrio alginolyticus]KIP80638.1 hypothetical protein SN13_22060 [Vibrio alginolyticus]
MSPLKGGLCFVQRQLLLLYSLLLLLMSYISAYYFFIDSNTIDKIASLPKVITPKPVLPKVRKLDCIYSCYLSSSNSGKIKDAFSMSRFTGKAEADDNHLLK